MKKKIKVIFQYKIPHLFGLGLENGFIYGFVFISMIQCSGHENALNGETKKSSVC